ncbi:MAG: LamG domain-containing protein [Bacteroidales bacterium]|nr:LamG domain-containing protein [Bacteroidales bacterium]
MSINTLRTSLLPLNYLFPVILCLFWFYLSAWNLQAQNLEQGLLLHYHFDTIEETTIPDVSGNNKHGIIYGSASLTEGWSGDAIDFEEVGDYALLPNNINADLNDFSIAVWIKGNASWNTWSRIFDFGRGTTHYMFLTPSSGNGATRFAFKNGGEEQIIDATSLLPYNEWVQLCLTVDYTDGIGLGILYINGVESGRNENISISPAMLSLDAETNQNYLAKSQFNDPGLNAALDDFRIYNRALNINEIALLNGFPTELMQQHQALNLGDLSQLSTNLNLPLNMGDQGVQVSWSSSHPDIISNQGLVQRPEYFNASVTLTATLSMTQGDKIYSLTKVFYAVVLALKLPEELLARWTFDSDKLLFGPEQIQVLDASASGFTGTCMNRADIITIGENPRFNVLSLGNSNGYFDLGTDIGAAIYALEDYSIGIFFRVDENYTNLSAYGNWVWNFSNSDQLGTDANGALWGALRSQQQTICKTHYDTEQTVQLGYAAQQGSWHHMAATYDKATQTATLYIDGVAVASNNQVNYTCANALTLSGRNGTLFNWLGRSCYAGDAYLAQTLLYDFQLHRVALSQTELNNHFNIASTLNALNSAYEQNPDYHNPNLPLEFEALSLEDTHALDHDLHLPVFGQIDPGIIISWSSSHPEILSNNGLVNRPDYVDFKVTLTATLRSGADYLLKTFQVVVKANEGSSYSGHLLLHHDFSQTEDSLVIDQAERQFDAVLKGGALIKEIGLNEHSFKVLDLGKEQAYLDLGAEIGIIMQSLSDFSIACYYRIDKDYQDLNWNGNCLWNFSNSDNIYTEPLGYMSAFLNNQGYYISTGDWIEEQSLTTGKTAGKDVWHHLAYTQQANTGTLYLDGLVVNSAPISALPFNTLQKSGLSGTTCNWIGRSPFEGDVYLQNTLVYDFRVYNKALSSYEISDSLLDVRNTLAALDFAYSQTDPVANPAEKIQDTELYNGAAQLLLRGIEAGDQIRILSLTGSVIKLYYSTSNSIIIESPDLAPGMFLLQLFRNKNCIWTTKVIIPNPAS